MKKKSREHKYSVFVTKWLREIDIPKHFPHCLKYIRNVKEEYNLELVKICTYTLKRNKNARKAMVNQSLNLRWLLRSM